MDKPFRSKGLKGRPKILPAKTETRTVAITLDFPECRIDASIDLPSGSIRLVVLALKMLNISSEVADAAAQAAKDLGFEVSCKKGCGACCRQLVPLSPPEAAMIFEFVESMPEPRKSEVAMRFALAEKRLHENRLFEKLEELQNLLTSDDDYKTIVQEYFQEQIPCPFLRDETCSIYEVRPSMCREYVVTSPAENCKQPLDRKISRLPISLRLSEALARTWASLHDEHIKLIPLILALKWTENNENTRFAADDSVRLLKNLLHHISEIANERERKTTDRSKGKNPAQ